MSAWERLGPLLYLVLVAALLLLAVSLGIHVVHALEPAHSINYAPAPEPKWGFGGQFSK